MCGVRVGTNVAVAFLASALAAGCTIEAENPVRYQEDFAGAPSPFVVQGQASDGRITIQLRPGLCRQIAMGDGLPPKVVREYPCRYPVANVRLSFTVPHAGSGSGMTDPTGQMTIFVPDRQTLGLGATDVATVFSRNQVVAQIGLGPLFVAANARLQARLTPPPPLPDEREGNPPSPPPPPPRPLPSPPPPVDQAPKTMVAIDCENANLVDTIGPGELRAFQTPQTDFVLPVFTLKNESGRSDFDIYAFGDSALKHRIAAGTHNGPGTELIIARSEQSVGEVYAIVKNVGPEPATFHLFCHSVDLAKTAVVAGLETLAQTALGAAVSNDSDSQDQRRNKSRAIAATVSAIEKQDLVEVGKDVAINEITMRLHEELGYDAFGDFVVNLAVSTVREIFHDFP